MYGSTKLAAENLVHTAGREHGLHTCVLRSPLMYGPGVKGNLQNMIQAIAAGRFPPLPETGNCRSLIDVRDVARALVLAAESPAARGRTYSVTDGRGYTTRQMQDLIRDALGLGPLRWSVPRGVFGFMAWQGDLLHRLGLPFPFDSTACDKLLGSAVYTSDAIGAELDFCPRYSLDQSLSEMIG
jgi:nucleoside-diphosphate-sugar epimerase